MPPSVLGHAAPTESGETTRDASTQLRDQTTELEAFIQALPYQTSAEKAWAKADAAHLLKEGLSVPELKDKYEFYSEMAAIRKDILYNAPTGLRSQLLQYINDILDRPTAGTGRGWKRLSLERIRTLVQQSKRNQSAVRYATGQALSRDQLTRDITQIMNAPDLERFKRVYSSIFTPDFWRLTPHMSPNDYPTFHSTLLSTDQFSFLSLHTLDSLTSVPAGVKSGLIHDAKVQLQRNFGPADQAKYLKKLQKIKPSQLADLLKVCQEIETEQSKRSPAIRRDVREINALFKAQNNSVAERKIDSFIKQYGEKSAHENGLRRTQILIKKKGRQVKSLQKRLDTLTDRTQRQQIIDQLGRLDQQSAKGLKAENKADNAQRATQLDQQISRLQHAEKWTEAQSAAKELTVYDTTKGQRRLAEVKRAQAARAPESDQDQEATAATSSEKNVEKAKKIEFYEKMIEHAENLKNACNEMGIPTDDPGYWKIDGILKRKEWLVKNGLWNSYLKFHGADKNAPPNNNYAVLYRWVDAKSVDRLSYNKAQGGLDHLKRLKESGYPLCVMSAGLSMDWTSKESPVYTPDEFISKCVVQLGHARGEK